MKQLVKHLLLAMLLCFGIKAYASNVIHISSVEGNAGDEVTISIGLENSDIVSSLQVSIPVTENLLSVVEGSGVAGTRCPSHAVTVGIKDGILNVFIYSTSMAAISGNSGEVAQFKVKLGSVPGYYSLEPSKITLADATGVEKQASSNTENLIINSAYAYFYGDEYEFGRVSTGEEYYAGIGIENHGNQNLVISGLMFSDVTAFSTDTEFPIVIEPGYSNWIGFKCIPQKRGSFTQSVTVLCNSPATMNTIRLKGEAFVANVLAIEPASGASDEEVTINLSMKNNDVVSGYQVEFDMPKSLQFIDGSFSLSERKEDHVSAVSFDNNHLRILVYSPQDKPFKAQEGVIGSFKVKLNGREGSYLEPTKAVLSSTINNVVENVLSTIQGGWISIECPYIMGDEVLNVGAVPVTQDCTCDYWVWNNGSVPLTISRVTFTSDHFSVDEEFPIVLGPWEGKILSVKYNSIEEVPFTTVMQIHSNDPALRLKEVKVSGSRFAPNYLSSTIKSIYTNGILSIDFSMDTYDIIKGFQIDVIYPSEYFAPFEDNIVLEPRANGMIVSSQQIDASTLRVFGYSLDNSGITAGDGKVMTVKLKPRNEATPVGSYNVKIDHIIFGADNMANKYAGAEIENSFEVRDGISITAKDYVREYGEANPVFEFTTEGNALLGTPSVTCDADITSSVGTYPIVIAKGSVTNDNDTYINGTLTITKAPLTISAKSYTVNQGAALPSFEAEYSGFKNNETSAVLAKQPSITTTATATSEPGEYDITISGAEAQNYEISYVNGKLTITEPSGIIEVSLKKPVDIYDLLGNKIASRVTTLKGLQKGVYIINGKKVIVK